MLTQSNIEVKSDSQLVVNQVNGNFAAKDKMMDAYLAKVTKSSQHISKIELSRIPREENEYADTLSKLVNTKDMDWFKIAPLKLLPKPTVNQKRE